MKRKKVTIQNPTGLLVNSAGVLCDEAVKYKSKVTFRYGDGNEANAKSILSVLGACIKNGDEIELCCSGEDEEEALRGMVFVVTEKLKES
ncbi:MAG: HPr family phosphocarrier protein [Lachnospiraceae bacterium]|nr:HPr family phosphocarrier protein [Lachnospiraceae bacterium]